MEAPAKLNLFLHVSGPRSDGYHDLQSLVAFTDNGDDLSFAPADDVTVEFQGPFGHGLADDREDNSIVRAALGLRGWCQEQGLDVPGAHICLTKNLPLASGIGGGSTDAAATLNGLCDFWNIQPPQEILHGLALAIGADVPVCLDRQPALMTGIGERLAPLPFIAPLGVVLANAGIGVPTGGVYGEYDRQRNFPPFEDLMDLAGRVQNPQSLIALLRQTRNDLQTAAKGLVPQIGDVLAALERQQPLLARMSGSGGTCFALFETQEQAEAAAVQLRRSCPDAWWLVATRLRRA